MNPNDMAMFSSKYMDSNNVDKMPIMREINNLSNIVGHSRIPKQNTLLEQQYSDFMGIARPIGNTFLSGIKKVISWIPIPERIEPLQLFTTTTESQPYTQQIIQPRLSTRMKMLLLDIYSCIYPHYVFFFLSFIYILYIAYLKIKYPFWNIQPVYHTYDWKPRIWTTAYLINTGLFLPKTKYNDNKFQMVTYKYDELPEEYYPKILDLLKCHYIPTDNAYFNINKRQFDAFHLGQNNPSYITIYSELEYDNTIAPKKENNPKILTSLTPSSLQNYKENIQGIITTRYINIHVFDKYKNDYILWKSNYVDFLCLHRENIKTRNVFQTHIFNTYKKMPSIKSFLFKKEIDLCPGVVPIVQYNTLLFDIIGGASRPPALPVNFSIIQIKNENLDILSNTIQFANCRPGYSIILIHDLEYYLSIIRQSIAHIYCLVQREVVYGIYMFKETYIEYDGEKEPISSIQCFSIMNIRNSELFYLGFQHSLRELKKTHPHKILIIENIGANCILVDKYQIYNTPLSNTNSALYTHNLIIPGTPYSSDSIFYFI